MSHRVARRRLLPVEEFAAVVSGKLQNAKAGAKVSSHTSEFLDETFADHGRINNHAQT